MNRALLLTFCAVFALPLLESQGVSAQQGEAYDPEARLAELGITLPEPPSPVANYVNGVRTGNLIFLAGKGPKRADGSELHGKLGADVSIEEGYEGARLTAINQLAVLKAMLGDLDRVVRVVKVLGMVNSDPSFVEQPAVINGFSDLIVQVFGERGRHARAAVGMSSLPRGQAVEIEMIVEVREARARSEEQSAPLRLKYLGAAGWEISDGNVVVLVDPYISRLRLDGGGLRAHGRGSIGHRSNRQHHHAGRLHSHAARTLRSPGRRSLYRTEDRRQGDRYRNGHHHIACLRHSQ